MRHVLRLDFLSRVAEGFNAGPNLIAARMLEAHARHVRVSPDDFAANGFVEVLREQLDQIGQFRDPA